MKNCSKCLLPSFLMMLHADEMAKGKVAMDAAYNLYEVWEKFYPYEFDKGEANMAVGDILMAQGKKDEARAKYQRVIELR